MTSAKTIAAGSKRSPVATKRSDRGRFLPWVFLAPGLIIYSVVVAYPMLYSAYLSLFRWDGVAPKKIFVGLQNYVTLLTRNEVFWVALKNNAIWLMAGLKVLKRNWLSDPQIAIYPVILAATWNAVGLPMLLFLAGLQTIPPEMHEAAKVEGAGPIRRFLYVTFPLLRETTLIVLAITSINALKAYDIVYAMTNGGPANRTQLLSTWMYFLTYNYNEVGLGTAIAVVLFSLTLIFAIPYIRMMTRKV
jgi:ABC-type sugar transport system permease subunit